MSGSDTEGRQSQGRSEESGASFLCRLIHEADAHWCLCVSGAARRAGVVRGRTRSPLAPSLSLVALSVLGAIRQHLGRGAQGAEGRDRGRDEVDTRQEERDLSLRRCMG